MTKNFVDTFTLSVTRALRDQLIEKLDSLTPETLNLENLAAVERLGGVYQLFFEDRLVYVGKSTKNLHARLSKHLKKISGRVGNLVGRVKFRCVYVDEDLDAVAPEKMLIGTFKSQGMAEWNNNGFGNNDPGKQRDLSAVDPTHFDALYPINLDASVPLGDLSNSPTVHEALTKLKAALPFLLRFENSKLDLEVPLSPIEGSLERTVSEWIETIVADLPESWVAIALPGYLISYPNIEPQKYETRLGSWTLEHGKVEFREHNPHAPKDSDESGAQ